MTSRQAAMMLVQMVQAQCRIVSNEEFQRATAAPLSHSRPAWVQLNVSPFMGADLAGHYVMKIGAN